MTTTVTKQTREQLYQHKCGHTLPSHEKNAFKSLSDKSKHKIEVTVTLKNNDQAIITTHNNGQTRKKVGKWTMVYDEGFDITIGNQSYFTFNMYSPKKTPAGGKKWDSQCYATLNGWYHIGNSWGCFYATKKVADPFKITNGEVEDKQNVVEGFKRKPTKATKIKVKHVNNPNGGTPTEIKDLNTISQEVTKLEHEKDNLTVNTMNFMETESKLGSKLRNKMRLKSRFTSQSTSTTSLKLSSAFKEHDKVVNRINKLDLGWKAYNYDQFNDLTIGQLNKLSGRQNQRVKSKKRNPTKTQTTNKSASDPNFKDLPKEFLDWKEFVAPARSQVILIYY